MNAPVKRSPDITFLLSHPFHLISLGFGSGLSPIMPGTAGTLFAWISYDLLTLPFSLPVHPSGMGHHLHNRFFDRYQNLSDNRECA